MTTPRIGAIVDDSPTRRRLLQSLAAAELNLTAWADHAESLFSTSPELDLLIVCPVGGQAACIDGVRTAKTLFPTTLLIAICPDLSTLDARRALRAGVDGLLATSELDALLASTIRAVRAGLACIPGRARASLEAESLSGREKQVLGLVVSGYTNAQIANKLYLAESTVKSHLSSAYSKLGVRTRKAATSIILDPAEGLGPGILAIAAA